MKHVIFLLFISISFSQSAIYYKREIEGEPVNVKFTKLLDFKVGSKTDTWKDDVNSIIHLQNEDNLAEKQDDSILLPIKLTVAAEQTTSNKNNRNHAPDINDGCKSLVGISKIPECKMIEKLNMKKSYPRSCREILENGNNKSGIYEIHPRTSSKPFSVLCDMETKGGGWTHIQKRFDGSEDFYRNWRDYKFGFGDLDAEFWIGLENIYHISAFETSELLIELTDRDKNTANAQYATFAISSEKDGYNLTVLKGFTGDAGDALTAHLGCKFTTFDIDQDENASGNCAQMYVGAWWYKTCHWSNLNGKYMNKVLSNKDYYKKGLVWNGFKGHEYFLAGSRMLIRPISA